MLEKYQEIDLFHDLSTKVTASLDLRSIAQLVMEEAQKLIPSTRGAILLLDRKTERMEVLWEVGPVCFLEAPLTLDKTTVASLLELSRDEIVNDISLDSRFINAQTSLCSLICVPLMTKEEVIGAIVVGSDTCITYSTEAAKLLTMLALQTAGAIEKALLYEQSCIAANTAQEQAQQLQRTVYELQQTQTKLLQSEKMSSLGQLVADVAHDINNPITCIGGNLGHAKSYTHDLLRLLHLYQQYYPQPVPEIEVLTEELDLEFVIDDLASLMSSMHSSVERIRDLVLSLRNFSRLDQREMTSIDVHEGLDSTLLILSSRLKPSGKRPAIQVIKQYGELPPIKGYANQLGQVFMNVIANAIDVLEDKPGPSVITICTSLSSEQSMLLCQQDSQITDLNDAALTVLKQSVNIFISDNGLGMDDGVRLRLFEPYFTTKPIGKGTGLGLSISHQIIAKHGGLLQCFSQPGQGTTFWIQLPTKLSDSL